MKTLILIRHAKSSWDDAAMQDFDRPLNARGSKDAGEMAERMLKKISGIEIFISSPALRARATAEKFAAAFGEHSQLVFEQGLYLAAPFFFNSVIEQIDNHFSTAAIFSHNPGITAFANTLTTVVKTDNIPTCGIFAVSANVASWQEFATATKTFLFYDYPKLHS